MFHSKSIRLSVLFLSASLQLSAQLAHTQMNDPWDDIQYRQPIGAHGSTDNSDVRDFVSNRLLRSYAAAGIAIAAGNNILGQNNGFSQIAHGPPQPPALIAQPQVRRLFAQFVFGL